MKIYWNKESNSKNLIGQRVKELRTERQLSQKALAEQLQLAGYEFSDLTVLRIEQGTRFVPDYEVVAPAEPIVYLSCPLTCGHFSYLAIPKVELPYKAKKTSSRPLETKSTYKVLLLIF